MVIFSHNLSIMISTFFCSSCKRVGHTADNCRVNFISNLGAPNPPRGSARGDLDTG